VLPGVSIQVQKESGGEVESTLSDENGRFVFQLLPPGTYQLQASKLTSGLSRFQTCTST
jgi:Cna protein B-type domain.